MTEKTRDKKSAKREAQKLSDQATALFAAGDYHSLREINNKIGDLAPETDMARVALRMNHSLDLDPFIVRFAVGVFVLYSVGWLVGLLSNA